MVMGSVLYGALEGMLGMAQRVDAFPAENERHSFRRKLAHLLGCRATQQMQRDVVTVILTVTATQLRQMLVTAQASTLPQATATGPLSK
ncbi:hypothetical protein HaLaN_29633 [Haematococcus lacustris]|uniref:Uncharacterized protein n=1 Tax=Haematococcus lacustris TaxID=44745 RepID=A0A6A0ADI3_HAELA|nr:hypothetical protein HaLaN_29633 [Haematococcus lacustris]